MFPYAFSPPFVTDTANDPETAKTLHSTIRWNKIADVKIMVDSKVREIRRPSRRNGKTFRAHDVV
jgi:hypothetical protein